MHHMLKDDDNYKVYTEKVIERLEMAYGEIKHKFAIGAHSKKMVTRLEQSALDINNITSEDILQEKSDIDGLIMIDREVDLYTPFLMAKNYETLVDECMGGIQGQTVNVNNKIICPDEDMRTTILHLDEDED